MRYPWKSVLGLWAIGIWLGVSSPAHAASGVGPYYATPSWDQTLPGATRFIDLTNMPGAVLDRETGLVWEKVPSTTGLTWLNASNHCVQRTVGGRKGWRLPTIQDLASLIDPAQAVPSLSSGHPFTVQSSFHWSATNIASVPGHAWVVDFFDGRVFNLEKSDPFLVWCVRGGPGLDSQ